MTTDPQPTEQERAALSIRTAADTLTAAAALLELGETEDALRFLKAVRDALEASAEQQGNWANIAQTIDDVLAPTLAPGLELGQQAFNDWQATQPGQKPAPKKREVN